MSMSLSMSMETEQKQMTRQQMKMLMICQVCREKINTSRDVKVDSNGLPFGVVNKFDLCKCGNVVLDHDHEYKQRWRYWNKRLQFYPANIASKIEVVQPAPLRKALFCRCPETGKALVYHEGEAVVCGYCMADESCTHELDECMPCTREEFQLEHFGVVL